MVKTTNYNYQFQGIQ